MADKKLNLSVVIPVYNSALTLPDLKDRLEKVLNQIVNNKYELVFVNDGSSDNSWEKLIEIAAKNENVISINLTRNFGQHNALLCGFSYALGDYIITIDDDLQTLPEEIPKLYKKIQSGYDVVYGISESKQHSKYRNLGSEVIQLIYRKTFNINSRVSSFRILKKDIVKQILLHEQSFTFIDGLICWFTTNIGNTGVRHYKRKVGESGYSVKALTILALNMITKFSIAPLQVASLTGIIFAFFGFIFGLYILFKKLFFGIPVSGFTSIIVIISMLSGVQLITVGILGEYIGRIHSIINQRPQYAIREVVNFKDQKDDR